MSLDVLARATGGRDGGAGTLFRWSFSRQTVDADVPARR
jgi:hypothetical protein